MRNYRFSSKGTVLFILDPFFNKRLPRFIQNDREALVGWFGEKFSENVSPRRRLAKHYSAILFVLTPPPLFTRIQPDSGCDTLRQLQRLGGVFAGGELSAGRRRSVPRGNDSGQGAAAGLARHFIAGVCR